MSKEFESRIAVGQLLFQELPFCLRFDGKFEARSGLQCLPFYEGCSEEDEPLYEGEWGYSYAARERNSESTHYNLLYIENVKYSRSTVPRGKRLRKFDLFTKLPRDIVLEILDNLHPVDLWNLSRTSSKFIHLRFPESTYAWNNAHHNVFQDDPHSLIYPECPPEINPWRWATFLFGSTICHECGLEDGFFDFTVRRRLCTWCLNHLFIEVDNEPHNILDDNLLPQSFRRDGYELSPSLPSPRVNRESFDRVIQKLASYGPAEDRDGLHEANYQELKRSLRDDAVQRQAHASHCESVVVCLANRYDLDRERRFGAHGMRVQRKLVQDGHHTADIADTIPDLRFPHPSRLSRTGWLKLRPSVETILERWKGYRLRRERELLIRSRKVALAVVVQACRREALPATWPYWPPQTAFCNESYIEQIIQDPEHGPLDEAAIREYIPSFVERWRRDTMRMLASMAIRRTTPKVRDCANPEEALTILDLATTVFTCPAGLNVRSNTNRSSVGCSDAAKCLFGWDEAGTHFPTGCQFVENLCFNSRGHWAASTLVSFGGFDPDTTTATEMDAANLRFLCMNCTALPKGRRVMKWREAVRHFIEMGDSLLTRVTHESPSWQLLTSSVAECFRQRETDASSHPHSWVCNHCPVHFKAASSLSRVKVHVRNDHDIDRPAENLDYVYIRGSHVEKSRHFFSEHARFTCNMCKKYNSTIQLYSEERLAKHLMDKHNIRKPSRDSWGEVNGAERFWPPERPLPFGHLRDSEFSLMFTTTIIPWKLFE